MHSLLAAHAHSASRFALACVALTRWGRCCEGASQTLPDVVITCCCVTQLSSAWLLRASQQGSLRMVTRLVIWCSTTNGQQVVVEALCNHKCDTNMCVLLCKPPCCKCQTRSTSRCLRCQRILIA
jgi:hypothetical protein